MAVTTRNRNNPLIWECDGQPSTAQFLPGGVNGLTLPLLMIDRTTRTLYAVDTNGALVSLVAVPVS